MSDSAYRPPKLRSIFLGIVAALIAIMLLCSLGEVVKFTGSAFLLVPKWLGLTQVVEPEEVRTVDLATTPNQIRFVRPGLYAVYTDDYDLLVITDALIKQKGSAWLKVKALNNGQAIPVTFVERGLQPYDTPLAKGRPALNFFIAAPGAYELTHPRRNVKIFIVPDYTTGNETALTAFYVLQIGLVAGLVVYAYRRRTRTQRAYAKALQEQSIQRAEAMWQKIAAKQKKDPPP